MVTPTGARKGDPLFLVLPNFVEYIPLGMILNLSNYTHTNESYPVNRLTKYRIFWTP